MDIVPVHLLWAYVSCVTETARVGTAPHVPAGPSRCLACPGPRQMFIKWFLLLPWRGYCGARRRYFRASCCYRGDGQASWPHRQASPCSPTPNSCSDIYFAYSISPQGHLDTDQGVRSPTLVPEPGAPEGLAEGAHAVFLHEERQGTSANGCCHHRPGHTCPALSDPGAK